ncbi:MAG: 4-(cytidine 5'-diphospho)-2-C-methyl-D-erythritol kinase [bacterium]
MITFANAKINIGLRVIGKRADGYHDIESLLYPIPLYDVVEFHRSRSFSLITYGIDISTNEQENLIYKTWKLARQKWPIEPVSVQLLKNIPLQSGLGGGSSDAAFFMDTLKNLFQLDIHKQELKSFLLEIGSDCPFFIENTPAMITGRGEQVNPFPLSLSGKWLVVMFHGDGISTPAAYAKLNPVKPKSSLKEIADRPVREWRGNLVNDFEDIVFPQHPALKKLKEELYAHGALYASLSGSGSAIYGIFDDQPKMRDKRIILSKKL